VDKAVENLARELALRGRRLAGRTLTVWPYFREAAVGGRDRELVDVVAVRIRRRLEITGLAFRLAK
jgi:hypothetical protein